MSDDDLELPMHDEDGSKHDRGRVLVVGGGRETPGAVLLAGLAALRVGAGTLQVATVASAAPTLAVHVPEARVVGLAESSDGEIAPDAADAVAALAESADAVLVGPGVLDDVGMDAVVRGVVDSGCRVVVLDAGALPALTRLGRAGPHVVAIPNASEMELLGPDPGHAAATFGCVVACRDATTVVASPDGRTWTDSSGTLGLATSGSGDVAAGAIAGLAARGASPEAAALWGARLHGRAGERLAERVGRLGFLARELLDELAHVLPD
jgi:ADP-dependent NAD(P)H-hydrate dehydratase